MEGAMWAAGGSATVVSLSGYWWYRLRSIETRAERLMRRMRIELDALQVDKALP